MPQIKTTRSLGYIRVITKIPEFRKVECTDYHLLPCANDHSLVVIYDSPFDIVGVIYGIKDSCQKGTNSHKAKLEILHRGRQFIPESKEVGSIKLDCKYDDEELTSR